MRGCRAVCLDRDCLGVSFVSTVAVWGYRDVLAWTTRHDSAIIVDATLPCIGIARPVKRLRTKLKNARYRSQAEEIEIQRASKKQKRASGDGHKRSMPHYLPTNSAPSIEVVCLVFGCLFSVEKSSLYSAGLAGCITLFALLFTLYACVHYCLHCLHYIVCKCAYTLF